MAKRGRDHARAAIRYAERVADGKVVACKLVTYACERFLRDLKRRDLMFDRKAANKAARFIELLPHMPQDQAVQ